jgi:cysteinyl-tRNA synthetase
LHIISDAKAKHDASKAASEAAEAKNQAALAELNLGLETKDAHAKATELFAQADAVQKQSQIDAAETVRVAQVQAAFILAEAQGVHDAATATKAAADADREAAVTARQQLAAEREAARRLGEQAELARATFEFKTDCIRIIIDEFGNAGTAEDMGARIRARQAALKPIQARLS